MVPALRPTRVGVCFVTPHALLALQTTERPIGNRVRHAVRVFRRGAIDGPGVPGHYGKAAGREPARGQPMARIQTGGSRR